MITVTPVALFCMMFLVFGGGIAAGWKLTLLVLGLTTDKVAKMHKKATERLEEASAQLEDAARILEESSAEAEALFNNASEHLAVAEAQREATAILLAEAQEKLERANALTSV